MNVSIPGAIRVREDHDKRYLMWRDTAGQLKAIGVPLTSFESCKQAKGL
jgi:hypothetical protein